MFAVYIQKHFTHSLAIVWSLNNFYFRTLASHRVCLELFSLTVLPACDGDKVCDETRYVTLHDDVIALDDVGLVDVRIVALDRD